MKTKHPFRLFIYCSIFVHLLGGAFYYYKKNSLSFPFFRAKKTLVSENAENSSLIPAALENTPHNLSSAVTKNPPLSLVFSKGTSISEPEIKSPEQESSSADLQEVEFQKIDLPKESAEESSTLKEQVEVTKIRTEGADFVISRINQSEKFLQKKEESLIATKESEIETEESGQFSEGVNLSEESLQDKNKLLKVKEQVVEVGESEIGEVDHLSAEADQLKELSEGKPEPLKVKEGREAEFETEVFHLPGEEIEDSKLLKTEEKTEITKAETIESSHFSEEAGRSEEIPKNENEPLAVKEEAVTEEMQIEKVNSPLEKKEIKESLKQEAALPSLKKEEIQLLKETEEKTENFDQKPSITENSEGDFATLKESSNIPEVESLPEKIISESKKKAPLFRKFLDLKQRPGNPDLTYPVKARRIKAQGSISLIFYVTTDGLVEKIQIESSSGHTDLDNSVMRTLARYQFLPQQPGWVRHKVNFILKGENVEFLKLRTK